MIVKEMENLIKEEKKLGTHDSFIRNILKEYLQVHLLYYLYTSSAYKQNLIFTGGTCLRHFYGLERLSEDIDFDVIARFSATHLMRDLKLFFATRYHYSDLSIFSKQKDQQILLKFPVLKKLGLARRNESDLLYIKIDISPILSDHYTAVVTSKNGFGLNYAARHYDLPSLMAGKLHAILLRRYKKGKENRDTTKGRDYFDLLWFVKNGVKPNLARLSDMLSEKITLPILEKRIDEKVNRFITHYKSDYTADMSPLIRNPEIITTYTDHYQEEYLRFKSQSFSERIRLFVTCQNCMKEFSSGISINQSVFESAMLQNSSHRCPFCRHINTITDKRMYVPR